MNGFKKIILFFLGSVFFFVLGGILWPKEKTKSESVSTPTVAGVQNLPTSISTVFTHEGESAKVTKVIDGDTIVLEKGQIVRYIGIDTPETKGDCFSAEATKRNRELVLGKSAKLEKDVSETDRYGRLLRYVYVGDVFVNDALVREGYAKISTYPPDVKHQQKFFESERYARENNLGLWSECSLSPGQSLRTEIPASSLPSFSNLNLGVTCSSNHYNCSDFKFQAEAQSVFDYCMKTVGYDVHKLDRDADSRVCETLP